MKYIKRIKIEGFKKFRNFDLEFNKDMNILVGDNESGKSTILEAIDIVLSQKYKNYDKYIVKELLNKQNVEEFIVNPKVENLPIIKIDIEFELDANPKSGLYYGTLHNFEKNKMFYGISFKCEILPEVVQELIPIIESGEIPYEYYQMSWNTFQGDTYLSVKKPINFLLIDTDDISSSNSYNYYNRELFINNHDNNLQSEIRSKFRNEMNQIFDKLPINNVSDRQKFGINEKKIIFENVISIFDEKVLLENKGKGRENIIKTQMALDKKSGKIDVLAIEEPESHLSFINLKIMIEEIKKQSEKQIIITTHESMIASSLNLKNILWIQENNAETLKDISEDDCDFFLKTSNNNMLQFILSKKVILVEGPTEFMLIPIIFEKINGTSLEKEGITLIDCGGIKYKRYLNIAGKMNKRIAVLTDNDNNPNNIAKMNSFNSLEKNKKIYMDNSLDNWTWEVCFYNLNKEKLKQIIKVNPNSEYIYHKKRYEPVLGKMLNNKTETAYSMLNDNFDYVIPDYIIECLKWIKE